MSRPWNKGVPSTEEEKKAVSEGISEEARERCSERMKEAWRKGKFQAGFKLSEAARKKISKANKQRKVTEETKEKIRKARIGKPGLKMSKRVRKLHSERMKNNNPMFDKEVLKNHPVLRSGRYFLSAGEKKLCEILTMMKIKFEHQKQIPHRRGKGYYTVDFFLTNNKAIIEFDGYHSHRDHPEKDGLRDEWMLSHFHYKTLRLAPLALNNRNRKKLLRKIKEFSSGK